MKKKDNEQPRIDLGTRWAAPAMVISAVIGLVWIVVFYATAGSTYMPHWYTDTLGNWNLAIGMGFVMLAFVFATKWK